MFFAVNGSKEFVDGRWVYSLRPSPFEPCHFEPGR